MDMTSTLFYALLTLLGGLSALELTACASASGDIECSLFVFNSLRFITTSQAALARRSAEARVDPLWIDDFDIEVFENEDQFCKPNHSHFAIALCIYFASVTTLYRRYQGNSQLRNLIMAACIGLPFLAGMLTGQTMEYMSVALVPVTAWAGLAAMPLIIWIAEHDTFKDH